MIKKVLIISLILFGFTLMPKECLAEASAKLDQAEACMENIDYEQAETIYKTIVTDYPGTDDALEAQKQLVILYISWGKQPEADAALQQLIAEFSAHPDIAEAVCDIADEYFSSERFEKAREFFQYVLDNQPGDEQAMWSQAVLAMYYIGLGDDPNAQVAIEKLLTEFSENKNIAGAVNNIADQYCSSDKYEEGRELFQYVLENWPDSEEAIRSQVGVVSSNIFLGDDIASDAAIDQLIAKFSGHPKIAEAIYEIAEEYFRLQKQERASHLFQYVIDNWPNSEGAIMSQVGVAMTNVVLADDPNVQTAIEVLIADFNDNPDLARVLFLLGEEYCKKALQLEHQGLVAQAEDSLRKGIAVCDVIITEFPEEPAIADAYLFSGTCYRRLGQYEKAIEYFQKLVSNWPDSESVSSALSSMSGCYEKLKESGDLNKSEANALIEQAYKLVVEKHPGSPALIRGASLKLGWLNFKRGQWLEATQYFELSLEKIPEDRKPVHILYALGRAYEEIGQLDKAIQAYNEFINTVPSIDPRVEKVRVRLEKLGITSDN